MSAERHIVFDITNTLVREVPRDLAPHLDQKRIISFKEKDRDDLDDTRHYHYMKMHYVERMLTKISQSWEC